MNSQLSRLTDLYKVLENEGLVTSNGLDMTLRHRGKTYTSITERLIKIPTEDVLAENEAYLHYLGSIISSSKVPNGVYSKVVSMVTDSHSVIQPLLGDVMLEQMYEQELATLRGAFKELKKHPLQAGCKVKDIKSARDLVAERLSTFQSEKEDFTK
ncbi:MAG: hypothetical protein E7354_02725 [Clostridiales bacterium]|nr:hypothetical protein [Clostridiales bacterium]